MRINTGETKMQVGVDQQFHFITSARQLDIDEKTIKISNDIVVDGTISYTGRLFQVSGSIFKSSVNTLFSQVPSTVALVASNSVSAL